MQWRPHSAPPYEQGPFHRWREMCHAESAGGSRNHLAQGPKRFAQSSPRKNIAVVLGDCGVVLVECLSGSANMSKRVQLFPHKIWCQDRCRSCREEGLVSVERGCVARTHGHLDLFGGRGRVVIGFGGEHVDWALIWLGVLRGMVGASSWLGC